MLPYFNVSAKVTDVKEIIKDIKNRIEEKKKAGIYINEPELEQNNKVFNHNFSSLCIDEKIEILNFLSSIDLEGEKITSHRPVLGLFIKSVKKFFRFWTRKYTDTIFSKQSQFNSETVELLTKISNDLEMLKKEMENIKKQRGD